VSDPFTAEIRMFPFDFAPRGWATCDGQLLPLSQNTALFSLLGTTYGGNGKSTFALPDLQGRAAMHPVVQAGRPQHPLGESAGSETVTLLQHQIPAHTHTMRAAAEAGEENDPSGAALGVTIGNALYNSGSTSVAMAPQALTPNGGGQPHNNMQPHLALMFCIQLQGIFPPRPT
jgi:microcystin-dependent protein